MPSWRSACVFDLLIGCRMNDGFELDLIHGN